MSGKNELIMDEKNNGTVKGSNEQFVLITRAFNAPRELVFKAWIAWPKTSYNTVYTRLSNY